MKPDWVDRLGAELKRDDDDLFDAAHGVVRQLRQSIHAVVIETVPRYLLETNPATVKLDEHLVEGDRRARFPGPSLLRGQGPALFLPGGDQPEQRRGSDQRQLQEGLPARLRCRPTVSPRRRRARPGLRQPVAGRGHPRPLQGPDPALRQGRRRRNCSTPRRAPAPPGRFTATRRRSSTSPAEASPSLCPTPGGRWRR